LPPNGRRAPAAPDSACRSDPSRRPRSELALGAPSPPPGGGAVCFARGVCALSTRPPLPRRLGVRMISTPSSAPAPLPARRCSCLSGRAVMQPRPLPHVAPRAAALPL
jgi:hypothetical protein